MKSKEKVKQEVEEENVYENNRDIVYLDGSYGHVGYSPIAVVYNQKVDYGTFGETNLVVDPIFNSQTYNNLYGRLMTLVEATTESYKLKSVKDLFSRELNDWSSSIYESARDIATSNLVDSSHSTMNNNIYLSGRSIK